MNCTAFREAVANALERRTLPHEAIAAHLQHCRQPRCCACWREAHLLAPVINEWRQSPPAVDVSAMVMARWKDDRRRTAIGVRTVDFATSTAAAWQRGSLAQRRTPGSGAAWGTAVAALALLLAVLPIVALRDDQPPDRRTASDGRGSPRAGSPTRPDTDAAHPEVDPTSPPGAPGELAGLSYVSYAQTATSLVTDVVVRALEESDAAERPSARGGWFGWEPAWTPVGDEMNAALDDLLESLPAQSPRG